jgi:hypothetical protein
MLNLISSHVSTDLLSKTKVRLEETRGYARILVVWFAKPHKQLHEVPFFFKSASFWPTALLLFSGRFIPTSIRVTHLCNGSCTSTRSLLFSQSFFLARDGHFNVSQSFMPSPLFVHHSSFQIPNFWFTLLLPVNHCRHNLCFLIKQIIGMNPSCTIVDLSPCFHSHFLSASLSCTDLGAFILHSPPFPSPS